MSVATRLNFTPRALRPPAREMPSVGVEHAPPPRRPGGLPTWVIVVACVAAFAVVAVLAMVRIDLEAQFCLAFATLAVMVVLRRSRFIEHTRLFFLLCSAFLSMRYVCWRTTSTLGYNGFADFILMMMMYGAELYGIVLTLGGLFVNSRALERPGVPLNRSAGPLPTVDVYVPSYNEPPEMLEITLRAALDMRYDRERVNVYLLDDGGTEQKRTQTDPVKAAAAQERALTLSLLAARHGAQYLSRERNEHAKAGNINAALAKTSGELIVIFDADHVPTADFLEKTVGHFQRDSELFLLQTPHFFSNPDPLEKNLGMFGKMPPENEMFYSVIQRGLDFWNASFFCGSAAVLRRKCLMEIGGITGTSITEDAETALVLHARGYRSAYLNEPLIAGLQPETFASFVVQRVRWAQGMIQLLLFRNPLRMKGLKLAQRICYFSNAFFWFFCYARVVFLLAPALYLLFGLQFYNATLPEFFAYGLPQMAGVILTTDYLFGKYRWTLISEVYEMLLSLFSLRGVIAVLLNPRAPTFNVTPKGEQSDADQISELAGPFYAMYLGVLISAIVGVWRLIDGDTQRGVIASSVAWSVLNLVLLNACIGVLYERRQRRVAPRVPADIAGTLLLPESANTDAATPVRSFSPAFGCHIVDLSAGGAKLIVPFDAESSIPRGSPATLDAFDAARGCHSQLPVIVRGVFERGDGTCAVGVEFADRSVEGLSDRVSLVYGDSGRWRSFRDGRNKRIGIRRGLGLVVRLGTVHALAHYRTFFTALLRYVAKRLSQRRRDLRGVVTQAKS
ncbi:UDP-forming cellulose synthase catalytic subunit [Caballeronia sp. LP006]|uniref:UDP-forming cellulose synthase catalytic subunit n=1 Tax=Caballeronia sp. LP006 TaxID=3038552 RepID=UPI0028582BC2|nr:UDP-forming cellulose synthase catalytic subunit [Caballeronia sp. LP006]MDR5828642.1 UDP-forming cellulose synthase catalytic subunit [Caballeronia sp. LP006]